jgi:ABC-type antimicrobial peptide transport system permease subunit
VKLRPGTEKATLEQIERRFRAFHPEYPFTFTFLDDAYQALYQAESRVAALSGAFSVLTVVISCLGLFGLASFTTERRVKEIGIRKILGASVPQIVGLLTAEYTRMVGAAMLIALPVSFLLASRWLDGFAYKIDLHWWIFAGAAGMALLIAWLTVGAQTLKAATVHPARCLQNE